MCGCRFVCAEELSDGLNLNPRKSKLRAWRVIHMKITLRTILLGFVIVCAIAPEISSAASSADRLIAQAQYKIRRNPANARAYYELGDAYIQKGRESGDASQFELAEKALRKSLEIDPRHGGVLRNLAHVLASRHDFSGAAAEAKRAIALNAQDADAHAVLGDAYMDLGQYEDAGRAYDVMISLRESLSSYSRLSGLKSVRGDTAGAIGDLKKAIALGTEHDQPPESIAWAEWQLGMEYFAVGRLAEAEAEMRAALVRYPNYHRAVAGLAQVRAAKGQYNEAISLYQKTLNAIPYPDYAAALGDLYVKVGRPADAKKSYELVEYIGRLNSFNQALYNRELAFFYCDHDIKLVDALGLAQNEIKIRRDVQGFDLLAWSLYKNGRHEEARAAIADALRLGTRDARLFFHAGMIYKDLGEKDKARESLQRALATNPAFHVLHADVARKALAEIACGQACPEAARLED